MFATPQNAKKSEKGVVLRCQRPTGWSYLCQTVALDHLETLFERFFHFNAQIFQNKIIFTFAAPQKVKIRLSTVKESDTLTAGCSNIAQKMRLEE